MRTRKIDKNKTRKWTKEEVFNQCVQKIDKPNSISGALLLELATGTEKTKICIDLVNYLITWHMQWLQPRILIIVAKRIQKQTWADEIAKWKGIKNSPTITMECYESLHKHQNKSFDFIIADEVHRIGSNMRLEQFSSIPFRWFIGFSAAIPCKLKTWFKHHHAEIVSCNILEAIKNNLT